MIDKQDRILITGATGLIGSHIARRLWQEGYHNLIATKRSTSKLYLLPNIADEINWIEADVTDVIGLESCFDDVDVVIHTAAVVSYDPKKKNLMDEINVGGTANMVNLALHFGVKKFVHISSVAALGKPQNTNVRDENTEWDHSVDTTDYAISKYKSEKEAWRGYAEGLDMIILWIAKAINAKVPSRALTPLVRNIAWRLDWLKSKLIGSSQLLTAASANSTAQHTHYDNTKSIEVLGLHYRPLQLSINDVAEIFLQSQKERKDYGVMPVD